MSENLEYLRNVIAVEIEKQLNSLKEEHDQFEKEKQAFKTEKKRFSKEQDNLNIQLRYLEQAKELYEQEKKKFIKDKDTLESQESAYRFKKAELDRAQAELLQRELEFSHRIDKFITTIKELTYPEEAEMLDMLNERNY